MGADECGLLLYAGGQRRVPVGLLSGLYARRLMDGAAAGKLDEFARQPVAVSDERWKRLSGPMKHLRQLEDQSVYILREAYKHFDNLAMLWSMGKDSTVLLWLARKAFFGHVPFPLLHVDTSYKIPAMIEYRDRLAREWRLNLVVGQNKEALGGGDEPHDGTRRLLHGAEDQRTQAADRATKAIRASFSASGRMKRGREPKERYFSPRDKHGDWDFRDQPPELWDQFKTTFPPGTHIRIHPLLDWTEINIWEYIKLENIPFIDLYLDKGDGTRYRSLGCAPCTTPIKSTAKTVDDIIEELRHTTVAERSGRAQDEGRGMELLRKDGYM